MSSYFIQDISSSCLLGRIIKGPHVERSVRDLEDEGKQHQTVQLQMNKSPLVWTWCQIVGATLSSAVKFWMTLGAWFISQNLSFLKITVLRMFACDILINIIIIFCCCCRKRSLLFPSFFVVAFQIQKPMRIN